MRHSPLRPSSLQEVHTANSGFISLLGLVRLTVKINHIVTTVDAYVTRDLVCSMILGRDWIQKNRVRICFSSNQVSLHGGLTSVPLLPTSLTESLVMLLPQDVVIPPFHERFISGYVPVKSLDHVLFTPSITLQHKNLVLLPHSLLHIRNHHGIISIRNTTHRTKIIPRHTPLGLISPSTEDCSIHSIDDLSTSQREFSSSSSPVFACDHCAVCFPTETDLYHHLLICCNKIVSCSAATITKVVEHILDPNLRMRVHLMLHHHERLFDNSCSKGINCAPQSAINTGFHPPLAEYPRRISPSNREIMNDEIRKLLAQDIITPSNSPWASPVVILQKRDGSPRFCIDYRRVNAITQKDVYPLPRIDDVIDRLNGSTIFSKLDLRSGYFQVPLTSDERERTAFITPDGLWKFNRLPQGLKNSPSVFQRLMNQTLGSLRWDICLAYLDDVIVFSRSADQHLIDVNKVCQLLNASNFKLNSQKCSFFQNEISFLGHCISASGCLPNNENIRSILQFPTPQSSKAAHSFLQMIGFYRKFIPEFAQISFPLNKFTRKGFPFLWTNVEQIAFDKLKSLITSPGVLTLPDPSLPYTIRTDASRLGLGAVLLQEVKPDPCRPDLMSIYKPVAFASRSLKPAEKNYSAIELEALAIWWSVTQKFRSYVEGQQFFLETDHKPLISLMKKPYHNARIERWMESLQQYAMVIRHIPGKENVTADTLSRYPVDKPDIDIDDSPRLTNASTQTDLHCVNVVTTRSVTRQQRSNDLLLQTKPAISDSISSPISSPSSSISSHTSPNANGHISQFFDQDTLKQHQHQDAKLQKFRSSRSFDSQYTLDAYGVLCRIVWRKSNQSILLPYIPSSLITQVLFAYHDSSFNGAHFGIKRTFYKIRDRFYWPNMYHDIKRYVLSCVGCKRYKPSRRKPDGHLCPLSPPAGVWNRLAMDFVGPVPPSTAGNKYLLVLTDLFSRFVVTKAVPDNTSLTAASFLLYDVFMKYGVPREILTDNGCHFTSSLYRSLVKLTGCCHVKTSPYNPRANGQCERHNATLIPNLLALSNRDQSNWDIQLIPTTFNYNSTRHDTTGYTPFELMFARAPRFLLDLPSSSSPPFDVPRYQQAMTHFIQHATMAARSNTLAHQHMAKCRFDRHRSHRHYTIGQKVLIRNRHPGRTKFSPKFVGPYVVIAQIRDNTYRVKHETSDRSVQVTLQDLRSFSD